MQWKRLTALFLSLCMMGNPAALKSISPMVTVSATEEYSEGTYDIFSYRNYGTYIEISGCDKIVENVEIPSEIDGLPVTKIGDSAFLECDNIKTIIIPDSVTSIGHSAFYMCRALESVIIPDSVTDIGWAAFQFCIKLTSVVISNQITEIKKFTFSDCYALESVTIPSNVVTVGIDAFFHCTKLTSVTISEGVLNIGYVAFGSCKSLKSVTLPQSVISIGESAFSYCTSLETITIENPDCEIFDSDSTITDNAIIYGYKDSTAQKYAEKYSRERNFIAIDGEPADEPVLPEPSSPNVLIAKSDSVVADTIEYSTYSNSTSYNNGFKQTDKLQEVKDSSGNIYAVYGYQDSVMLISENSQEAVVIEKPGFIFGSATIDENDNLYILWGYSIDESDIETAETNNVANMAVVKYDLSGKIIDECELPINTTYAQSPFASGNANILVKDNILGCFYDVRWTKSRWGDGLNHQGSEFAAIDINTMELIAFSSHQGSHSFGVTMIPTEYGFAAIQMGDADEKRGISLNSYCISESGVQFSYLAKNGYKIVYHCSGQYGTNANKLDGNTTYTHMGGLAKSNTTYAIAGKSEKIYTSKTYYNSSLKTGKYDVFVKIVDQTLANQVMGLAGEDRIDEATGEVADRNVVWLTECNANEKAGQVKVVTLEDGSYCVLWEKFVDGVFDSVRYVILDECGNLLQNESEIRGARLSSTSIQPIVQGNTLTWAVADGDKQTITWYTIDLDSEVEIGDASQDDAVNVLDIIYLQKYLLGQQKLNNVQYYLSDINNDGEVDVFDLALLKRALLQQN